MEYSSSFPVRSATTPDVTFEIHKPSHGRRVEFDRLNADFRDRMRTIRKSADAVRDEIQRQRDAWNASAEKELAALKASPGADPAHIQRLENGLEIERLRSILANLPSTTPASAQLPILEQIVDLARNAAGFKVPAGLREQQQDLTNKTTLDIEGAYKPTRIKWGLKSITGLTINGQPATADSLVQDGPRDLVQEIYEAIERVSTFTPDQLKNSQWPITSSARTDGPKANTTATNAETVDTIADETAGNFLS